MQIMPTEVRFMTNRWKSVATGAAVAAALTLPAVADNWFNGPTRNFPVKSVSVHDVVGNLTIGVRDGGPVSVQVSGAKYRVDQTSVSQDDGTVSVEGGYSHAVWDWKHWFDFSDNSSNGGLWVKLTVPKGTNVDVDELVGDAKIGDTMAPIHFAAVSTSSTIGRVGEAHISLAGSGTITVGDIAGDLHAESAGAGQIKTGSVRNVHADLAGSGGLEVGQMGGGLNLDIAGSGDFKAVRVNGPVHADILGSGSVAIASGEANPLHLSIAGSGNFSFGGTAVDPHIDAVGSGNVHLHAYRGNLANSGMADVKIGD
jgi:hypothetical protein